MYGPPRQIDPIDFMKITRPYIIAIIAVAMVVITINAVYRVRYFGRVEKEYWESKEAGADAGAD
jgi:hypothetical protein